MSNKDYIYIVIIILLFLYITILNNKKPIIIDNTLHNEILDLKEKIIQYKDGVDVYQKQYDTIILQKEIIKQKYENIYIYLDTTSFNTSELSELFSKYTPI
jgi:hypothetical protein